MHRVIVRLINVNSECIQKVSLNHNFIFQNYLNLYPESIVPEQPLPYTFRETSVAALKLCEVVGALIPT